MSNCGKPVTRKESARIFVDGEKCVKFCSAECMSKKLKKNLREMERGNNMVRTCAVCGKRTNGGCEIRPTEELPELKKSIWLCSERCARRFAVKIKSDRTEQKRKKLESKNETATDEDYSNIWLTLKSKELKKLSMIGFAYLCSQSDKTPAGFYKELQTHGK